jgi:hypothetical protein
MKQPRISRRLLFQVFDTAFANPAPDLPNQQRNEHDQKPAPKFTPEDGHGQACLCNGEPRPFIELFGFDCSQGSVEKSLKPEEYKARDEKA